ncbi:PREDICTED: protein EFR3 homolog cmp44E isoform X2 [Nicrophorus vespilloides]|uniref:Protein EFR3 homolog cmp44E isoform X2 n=1 Tax=Nicrophorus vespilloides TaxID=110193 RepID=A0ABM1MI54_NICVS|nr:PREDICTED: protein EFR3 homolog cmp44E isoform X2 [Nicrophorus vespilloides]
MSLVRCCFEASDVTEVFEQMVQKCTDAGCCCGCCSALRPRYKRLVDNIFPVTPQDGLVKANMEKLTFYSLSSPEKLDRIGEYLYQKAARDIYRKRHGFVIIAMEAMDQLLVACHAQTLNLFVESFLKMVQKLLESTEPQLQILATQSFVKFANIEEDTPSYHRRYDFFVSKFSAMCHSGDDREIRDNIRTAGIRGLQAVVRKTVSDDLVENIWEPVHMDKIVPSLLFNMQDSGFHMKEPGGGESAPDSKADPPMLAETCMRELVGRASFGHIRAVLRPVLKHFDLHELWVPNQFAIHTFRIIIFSIQAQYSYTVVETLMAHLDDNTKATPTIRTSIVDVLSKIIAIAAVESVGPSVLEIINSLLGHLKDSVRHVMSQTEEKLYQEALINALGEFANHLPDYQKIEIMMFIMNKIPYPLVDSNSQADNLLQSILLKSLLKVGTKYQTIHLNTTFPISFLEPLLRMSLAPDPEMRLLVQRILHTLIDRHHNLEKLIKPTINVKELDLTLEKSSRPDLIFINKHGPIIYDALYTNLQMDTNTVENIEAVYTTLALLCVELSSGETVIDLLQLVLGIQSLALNSTILSASQKFHLHAIVISLLTLIPVVIPIPALYDYAARIGKARKRDATHLLPDLREQYAANCQLANKLPHLMIDQMAVCEYVKAGGLDPTRLSHISPYGAGGTSAMAGTQRHSWVETSAKGSVVELATGTEVDSASSSPGVQRKLPEEELTFESMKHVLSENPEARKEAEAEKREQISHTFRTASFNELTKRTQPKNKLNEIFKSLSETNGPRQSTNEKKPSVPVYEQNFPELFIH